MENIFLNHSLSFKIDWLFLSHIIGGLWFGCGLNWGCSSALIVGFVTLDIIFKIQIIY